MTDIRILLDEETAGLIDRLLGGFLFECIGKNDMAVINALLASAAILITTHCERTGQNFDEVATLCKDSFGLSLKISGDRISSSPPVST